MLNKICQYEKKKDETSLYSNEIKMNIGKKSNYFLIHHRPTVYIGKWHKIYIKDK